METNSFIMTNIKLLIGLLFSFVFINTANSQIPKGEMAGTELIAFKSAINNQYYQLYIKLPASYKETTKRFPVVYCLDGQWSFPLIMEIRGGLLYDNLLTETIFVGIAWPGNYVANRNRDFTPTHTDFDPASGGAAKFLEVIKSEIITRVNSAYHTDKINNALLGGSSGGLFVLYSLFQQPSPFNRFVANSPSLWYDDQLMFKTERAFAAQHQQLNAKLFTSSGSYEEESNPPMYANFIQQLKASNYKGFEMESFVVDKTGHGSEPPYAISRGLQFVFSKPALTLDTALLKQYAGHYEHDISFIYENGALYFSGFGRQIKMNAETNKQFYMPGLNGEVEFRTDQKDKVTGAQLDGADGHIFARRID
jgi:predicted alpha/beta superfamily hydrolase